MKKKCWIFGAQKVSQWNGDSNCISNLNRNFSWNFQFELLFKMICILFYLFFQVFASPYEALVIDFTPGINDFTRVIISRIFNKPLISARSAANISVKVIPEYFLFCFITKLSKKPIKRRGNPKIMYLLIQKL